LTTSVGRNSGVVALSTPRKTPPEPGGSGSIQESSVSSHSDTSPSSSCHRGLDAELHADLGADRGEPDHQALDGDAQPGAGQVADQPERPVQHGVDVEQPGQELRRVRHVGEQDALQQPADVGRADLGVEGARDGVGPQRDRGDDVRDHLDQPQRDRQRVVVLGRGRGRALARDQRQLALVEQPPGAEPALVVDREADDDAPAAGRVGADGDRGERPQHDAAGVDRRRPDGRAQLAQAGRGDRERRAQRLDAGDRQVGHGDARRRPRPASSSGRAARPSRAACSASARSP
jgi:hypothetical protein